MVYSIIIYSIRKCLLYTKERFWPIWYTKRDPKQLLNTRKYGRKYTKVFTVYEGPLPLLLYQGPRIQRSAYMKVHSTILGQFYEAFYSHKVEIFRIS